MLLIMTHQDYGIQSIRNGMYAEQKFFNIIIIVRVRVKFVYINFVNNKILLNKI